MLTKLYRAITPFKGKRRLGRLLFKNKLSQLRDVTIAGWYGCVFKVPNVRENIGFEIFINGVYENDVIDFIVDNIEKGKTLLDIGANIGAICIPSLKRRTDINCVCVEASPWVFEYLDFNLQLNQVSSVKRYNFAISDSADKTVLFYSPHDEFGKGSLVPVFTSVPTVVKTITIEKIIANLQPGDEIGFIKIDVEGFEYYAFAGGKDFLSQPDAPDILFEFVDWAENEAEGINPGDAQALLMTYGYAIYYFSDGNVGSKIDTPLRKGAAMFYATKKRK